MEIFYFLSGDPLFDPQTLDLDPADPADLELIDLRRRCVLMFLEYRYATEAAYERKVTRLKEDRAKEAWTIKQIIKELPNHVAPDVAEKLLEAIQQVMIEREVNEMDPDFSFYKALFGQDA